MKKWMKRLTAAVLGAVLVMGSLGSLAAYGATPKADEDMRAVWISTVYSADYPSTQNNAEAQKAEFIKKLDEFIDQHEKDEGDQEEQDEQIMDILNYLTDWLINHILHVDGQIPKES